MGILGSRYCKVIIIFKNRTNYLSRKYTRGSYSKLQ
jgi:hypothetical protein